MSLLAHNHCAVNLVRRFPDFPAPNEPKDSGANAVMDKYDQYAITWGAQELKERIAIKATDFNSYLT